jgi:hypothetical protein
MTLVEAFAVIGATATIGLLTYTLVLSGFWLYDRITTNRK